MLHLLQMKNSTATWVFTKYARLCCNMGYLLNMPGCVTIKKEMRHIGNNHQGVRRGKAMVIYTVLKIE